MRQMIAGNWKMFGTGADLSQIALVVEALRAEGGAGIADALLCPPATLLHRGAQIARGSRLALGGQDCHAEVSGAHTGDISVAMLADAGASHVILGHSERRAHHHETSAEVAAKALAARSGGLVPVICIGETAAERDSGQAAAVMTGMLAESVPDTLRGDEFVIAYEPVWAIGAGQPATCDQIEDAHGVLRMALIAMCGPAGAERHILYGGSVKPDNAREILSVRDVDGVLVGGASLKAESFLSIYRAAKTG